MWILFSPIQYCHSFTRAVIARYKATCGLDATEGTYFRDKERERERQTDGDILSPTLPLPPLLHYVMSVRVTRQLVAKTLSRDVVRGHRDRDTQIHSLSVSHLHPLSLSLADAMQVQADVTSVYLPRAHAEPEGTAMLPAWADGSALGGGRLHQLLAITVIAIDTTSMARVLPLLASVDSMLVAWRGRNLVCYHTMCDTLCTHASAAVSAQTRTDQEKGDPTFQSAMLAAQQARAAVLNSRSGRAEAAVGDIPASLARCVVRASTTTKSPNKCATGPPHPFQSRVGMMRNCDHYFVKSNSCAVSLGIRGVVWTSAN